LIEPANPPKRLLRVVAHGMPITQGSKTVAVSNGRSWLIEGRGNHPRLLAAWRETIHQEAALAARAAGWERIDEGPVVARVHFLLPRPQSAPKRRRTWPVNTRSGDLDKLVRACMDAITGIAFRDDAQVVAVVITKDWAVPPMRAGMIAEIEPLAPQWCRPAISCVLND
jgi:crossover junction endodeoxyribonuclease RusA